MHNAPPLSLHAPCPLSRIGRTCATFLRLRALAATPQRRADLASNTRPLRAGCSGSRATTVPAAGTQRDGWEPTEAGRQLMAHAEAMEAASLRLTEELAGGPATVAGTVRLGVPEVLGARVLTPRLPPLLAQYPELQIELLLLPRSPSLAAREADLTVTLEPPRSGRYYVTRSRSCVTTYTDPPSTWHSIGQSSSDPTRRPSVRRLRAGLSAERFAALSRRTGARSATSVRGNWNAGAVRGDPLRPRHWHAGALSVMAREPVDQTVLPEKCGSNACSGWRRRSTCSQGAVCESCGIFCAALWRPSRSCSARSILACRHHLPIQNRLKITPSKSSADTSPVISPIELPASRSSSANRSSCASRCAACCAASAR